MREKTMGARPRGAALGVAASTSVQIIKALFHTRLGILLPLVIILLLLALLLALTSMVAPIAPFIYPLF